MRSITILNHVQLAQQVLNNVLIGFDQGRDTIDHFHAVNQRRHGVHFREQCVNFGIPALDVIAIRLADTIPAGTVGNTHIRVVAGDARVFVFVEGNQISDGQFCFHSGDSIPPFYTMSTIFGKFFNGNCVTVIQCLCQTSCNPRRIGF